MKRHQVLGFLLLWEVTSAFVPKEGQFHPPHRIPRIHMINREQPSRTRADVSPSMDRHMAATQPVGVDILHNRRKCHSTSSAASCEKKMAQEIFVPF